jgi:hypothetical protein
MMSATSSSTPSSPPARDEDSARRRSPSSANVGGDVSTDGGDDAPPKGGSGGGRLVYGKDDALFGAIERQQREAGHHRAQFFGSVLDAGTGLHSLRWLASLLLPGSDDSSSSNNSGGRATDFTAVTADRATLTAAKREIDELLGYVVAESHDACRVLLGNWLAGGDRHDRRKKGSGASASLRDQLGGRLFDVILADYLIGAMDGYSPYRQDEILPILQRYLKPNGGRLYIVGLEPLPDSVLGDGDAPANVVCRVRQVRDACILLAGHRCYREYPLEWIVRQVEGTAARCPSDHLELVATERFPILYSHAAIVRQINVGRSKLRHFPDPSLANAMGKVLDDLEEQSLRATERCGGRIQLGFDYIVTCERKKGSSSSSSLSDEEDQLS